MAKSSPKSKSGPPEKTVGSKMPSQCGSHTEMISKEWTEKLTNPNYVVLESDFGFYVTTTDRLDTKLADPNRYGSAEFRAAKLREHLSGVEVSYQDEKVLLVKVTENGKS